jgi:hypothetical protein
MYEPEMTSKTTPTSQAPKHIPKPNTPADPFLLQSVLERRTDSVGGRGGGGGGVS